jgi:CRISPR-associated protein Cmr3
VSDTVLELSTLAPLLFRDGRPFAGGNEETRAQSLSAPLPHTVAGFVRTQLGNARPGWQWRALKGLSDDALHEKLRELHGCPIRSILVRDGAFMFPAPLNAVVDKTGRVYRLSPHDLESGEGTNLPPGLRPLLTPEQDEDFKPESGYRYWPAAAMTRWLLGEVPEDLEKIGGPPPDERVHVGIDPESKTGDDGKLFTVTYRSFEERERIPDTELSESERGGLPKYRHHRWTIRIKTDVKGEIAPVGHLGGERRPVVLQNLGNDPKAWPNKGQFEGVVQAIKSSDRLLFILTSPALFEHGWKPAWLTEDTGPHTPAGVGALRGKVKLLGAAVGRRVPVSGWNLREDRPKAVRWAVPAGSVYFLKLKTGVDREKLLDAWMKPLSDRQNDQRDGFGCALWGVW